jgi:threonine/homoserine/homoserine lactone efflux protein
MGLAIGDILPLAVGVAISPVPIIAIVLILGTPRARSNGPAFALGWLAGLSIAGGIFLAVASGRAQEEGDGPETWVSVVKLILGVLFVLLAVRIWHGRPQAGQEAEMPKWMRATNRFTAVRSLVFGVILSALNPKNLALTIAAAAAIAETGISDGEAIVVLAVFILIGSLCILAPVVLYFAMRAKAAAILNGLKTWMAVHNAAIMTVLLLVLGAKLIGDAIAGLYG